MCKIILLLCLNSFAFSVSGQSYGTNDNFYSLSLQNAISQYHQLRSINADLYNGTEYLGYLFSIEGHAYFRNADWQVGSIFYNSVLYDSVQLKYDLLKDALIIRHPNNFSMISLFSPRVQKFSFNGFEFVYINEKENSPMQSGFYQTLITGNLTVFAKRIKKLDERVKDLQVDRKFMESNQYYALINGSYHIIKKESDILDLVKEHKKELQQHLKNKGIRFNKSPENVLITIAEYYNNINK